MLTEQGKLRIFSSFVIDSSLPKFKKREVLTEVKSRRVEDDEDDDWDEDEEAEAFEAEGGSLKVRAAKKATQLKKRYPRLGAFFGLFVSQKDASDKPEDAGMEIEDFFYNVKNSTEQILAIDKRAKGYKVMMTRAKEQGQTALYEKLKAGLGITKSETQLFVIGMTKFLSEEKLAEFAGKAKRGLRLDWMANFTRIVPEDVIARKKQADELGCFDNYVVLHYDPESKSTALTQKQIEARKDPILFGVIRGSRRLYYVGDWVDELCDLTLDQIVATIGESAVEEIPEEVPEPKRKNSDDDEDDDMEPDEEDDDY